jgi:hypothetical protein
LDSIKYKHIFVSGGVAEALVHRVVCPDTSFFSLYCFLLSSFQNIKCFRFVKQMYLDPVPRSGQAPMNCTMLCTSILAVGSRIDGPDDIKFEHFLYSK